MNDIVTVTVNYQMKEKVLAMLRSLYRDVAGSGLAVQPVIVDNASGDGIADAIAREFHGYQPEPIVIAAPSNRGFGSGNNIALRQIAARYYFLVNPDIVFLPDHPQVVQRLHAYMETNPEIGMAAPRLQLPSGATQPSCMRFPAFLDQPIHRLDLHRKYRWARRRVDRIHMDDMDHAQTRPIDWAVSAAQFIRGSYLREIGGFDERYFMYFEDCDLCRTFWARGWPVYYKGDIIVEHGHERSSAQVPGLKSLVQNPLTRTHLKSLVQYQVKWALRR
ncbi:MAG: glycosyltransferase family 2 protein [bacterium]|nr:glycosyltransferase family 2 protein [bacterium]